MEPYEHILVEISEGVGVITLNRPEVLNAMNNRLGAELHAAAASLAEDDAVGCIVVTGAGEKAFSAGGDIHEQRENDARLSEEERDARAAERMQSSYALAACAKPTIGMMNGLAYGGAAVLATSLDIRIGCERTRFRFLAAAYGRINATWTLPNQVGWPMAKELLFSARLVEAEEAHRIGLLNHLVPADELRGHTMALATQIAANDRASVRTIKSLLVDNLGAGLRAQWEAEQHVTRKVLRGRKAEEAFPEFIARKGRDSGG